MPLLIEAILERMVLLGLKAFGAWLYFHHFVMPDEVQQLNNFWLTSAPKIVGLILFSLALLTSIFHTWWLKSVAKESQEDANLCRTAFENVSSVFQATPRTSTPKPQSNEQSSN
jgi:uncharacterized membrane protein